MDISYNIFSFGKEEPKEEAKNQVIVNNEIADNRVVSDKSWQEPDENYYNTFDFSCEEVLNNDADNSDKEEQKKDSGEKANANDAILTEQVKLKDEEEEDAKPNETESGDGCTGSAAEIMKMLDALFAKVEEFQITIDKQQDIIKSQKRQLEKYHENIFLKVKQQLLLDVIDILDGIEMSFEEYDRDNNEDYKKDNFIERIEGVRKQVIGVLENHSVIRVQDSKENPNVVSKRQNVTCREFSSDPSLAEAGFMYKNERPGYAMIDTDEAENTKYILLRPEEVTKVVYRPNTND